MSGAQAAAAGAAAQGVDVNNAISVGSVTFQSDGNLTIGTTVSVTRPFCNSPPMIGWGQRRWINITRTGGTGGVNFSAAQGAWTAIGSGLAVGAAGGAGSCTGTYQISSSVTGAPVVSSGTIACNNTI